jgi:hypothetical protein
MSMSRLHAHLRQLSTWYDEHVATLHDPFYTGDLPAVERILFEAQAALAQGEFTAEERQTLEMELLLHELTACNRLKSEAEYRTFFEETAHRIMAVEPLGPLAAQARAVHLIHLLGAGYRRGLLDLDRATVDGLLEQIDPDCLTNHVWYYLCAWAFQTAQLDILERAYGEQLGNTTGFLDDFFWLRTNLMYLITAGRATKEDVLTTIKLYPHPTYLSDFNNLFFPRLSQLNMLDGEIEAALDRRRAELKPLAGTAPQPTSRTRRVLGKPH